MYQASLDFFKPAVAPVVTPKNLVNNIILDLRNCFRYSKILNVMALVLGVLIIAAMCCSRSTYPTFPYQSSNAISFFLEFIKSIESLNIERLQNTNAVNSQANIIERLSQLKDILKECLKGVLKNSRCDFSNYQPSAERYAAHRKSLLQYQDTLK
jgi:hypothetical protein